MSLRSRFRDWLMAGVVPVPEPAPVVEEKPLKVTTEAVTKSRRSRRSKKPESVNPFAVSPALHPPGVAGSPKMAMDDATATQDINAWAFAAINNVIFDGQAFLGYPLLAELSVRPEYRRISETIARHMTRKWITFQVKGDAGAEKEPGEEDEDESLDEDGQDQPFEEPDAEDEDENPFGGAQDFAEPGGGMSPEDQAALAQGKLDAHQRQTDALKAKAAGAAPDKGKLEKVARIEERLEQIGAKSAFETMALQDGFFGRAHLYVDLSPDEKTPVTPEELVTSIGDGSDDVTLAKLSGKKDAIRRVKPVEAVWCYPTNYNSIDPLADDWYRPTRWFVMGKQLDATRLLTFVGREVPDILKPAYSFGGLAMTQMVRPYVENWVNTRQAVADIVRRFSAFVLKTKLTDALATQGDAFFNRLEVFNNVWDNSGVFAIDKLNEDFANVSAPLGGLDKLQAQAQEQMASIAGIPIVLLLMITPSGLNASSEGEIQAFWDWVHSYQESFFRENLSKLINMIQVCEFGDVDQDITFDFARLEGLSDLEWSQKQLTEAQMHGEYVDKGIVDAVEVRKVLAADAESPYHGIDVEDVPEPPAPELPPGFGGGGAGSEEESGDGKPPATKGTATGAPAGKARPAVPAAKAAAKELA